jgi:hypothetical protein
MTLTGFHGLHQVLKVRLIDMDEKEALNRALKRIRDDAEFHDGMVQVASRSGDFAFVTRNDAYARGMWHALKLIADEYEEEKRKEREAERERTGQ